MSNALDGLLVVAVEQAVAAPLCTSRLAASGARVIKIERTEGDFARNYDSAAKGESSYFTWINQGKESITLDFKAPQDKALLENLLAQADVLVQNLSPGALARAGFDNETLQSSNPRLITCDISGYGDDPALADLRAYDLLVQAESGLIEVSGGPGEAGRIGISICDIGAGMSAHAAILEALIARSVSGKGRALKIALFDVAAEWMSVPFIHAKYGEGAPLRSGLHHPSIAPYGAYETGDGVRTLISIQNEREWLRLCKDVFEDEAFATEPMFESNNQRVSHRKQLDKRIQQMLENLSATEFRNKLGVAKIAYGAINTTDDLLKHRALKTQAFANSVGDILELPISPVAVMAAGQDVTTTNRRAPQCGEHSEAIRSEFAPGNLS